MQGYVARGGQVVDASLVPVLKPRTSREENEAVKRGETPADWEEKPAKNWQKDNPTREKATAAGAARNIAGTSARC